MYYPYFCLCLLQNIIYYSDNLITEDNYIAIYIFQGQMQNLIEGRAMAHNTQIYLADHAFYVMHVIKLLMFH